MTIRLAIWISIGLLFVAGPITAGGQQFQPGARRPGPVDPRSAQQFQPGPRRPGPVGPRMVQPVQAPFALTPQQQAMLESVLLAWQRESAGISRFQCTFTRYEYDGLSPTPDTPAHIDEGEIKYESPDKGLYYVKGENVNGQLTEGPRTERWVSNGMSVFEYDYEKRKLTEHPLPPELQGKAIANGPMPFLFGAKADDLNARYWLRLVEPPPGPNANQQICLEARPKRREDAASYCRAEIILTGVNMQPTALQLIDPNGKDRTAFLFSKIKVNSKDPLEFLKGDPF
jgi:TIGR03009 family protein